MQDNEFYSKIPLVKRLRGCFIYSHDSSKRYLDLFMNNATLLFGHNPPNFNLAFKNPLQQGLLCPYPNIWQARLLKELSKKFVSYNVACYNTDNDFASNLLSSAKEPWHTNNDNQKESVVKFIRPFIKSDNFKYGIVLIPVITNFIIVISKEVLPSSNVISAVFCRTALRYVNRFESADSVREIALFDKFSKIWQRHECYLESKLSDTKHNELFDLLLKEHILISPSNNLSSLVPAYLSSGDKKKLIKLLTVFQDKL